MPAAPAAGPERSDNGFGLMALALVASSHSLQAADDDASFAADAMEGGGKGGGRKGGGGEGGDAPMDADEVDCLPSPADAVSGDEWAGGDGDDGEYRQPSSSSMEWHAAAAARAAGHVCSDGAMDGGGRDGGEAALHHASLLTASSLMTARQDAMAGGCGASDEGPS